MPPAASVTENSPTFIVCLTMRATPPSATLALEVVLTLSAVDGTGTRRKVCIQMLVIHVHYYAATSSSGDFDPLSTPVNFPLGSSDNAVKCVSVMVNPDNLVESEEKFSLTLSLNNSGTSLNLGNHTSTVTLTDSDGV